MFSREGKYRSIFPMAEKLSPEMGPMTSRLSISISSELRRVGKYFGWRRDGGREWIVRIIKSGLLSCDRIKDRKSDEIGWA